MKSASDAASIYVDGTYLRNNPGWHAEDSAWKAEQVLTILAHNKIDVRSVCEVGCGSGTVLEHLQRRMAASTTFDGYDISPQAIELCRPRQNGKLRFHLGDPFESGQKYDLALALDVFEHVEDYIGFVRRMRPIATYKIFHIPLDLSVAAVLRPQRFSEARRSIGHLHYFTKETALDTLAGAGYDVLDSFFTAGSRDLPARDFKSSVFRLPRSLIFALSPSVAARTIGGCSLLVVAK